MAGNHTTVSLPGGPGGSRFTLVAGAYALAGGLITLVGWFANIPRFTDWENNGISMMPNAAICSMGAGIALLLLPFGRRRLVAALGLFVGLIGGATLFEYATHINLGIDTLVIHREWGQRGTVVPGRMGPPGSTSWTVIGMGLVLATGSLRSRRAAIGCATLAISIAMLSLVGYLFGADRLFTIPKLTTIALQTSSIIFTVGIGIIVALPDQQPMKTLLADTAAGLLARRALPLIFLVPAAVGWLRLRGEQAGLFDTAFGTAARTIVEIMLFAGFLWWAVSRIAAYEQELRQRTKQLGMFLETAAIGLHRVGADGTILWVNEAELHLLGYGREEYVGRHIAEFHADQPVIEDILARLHRGERVRECPARMRCKDGSIKDVLIDSSVLFEQGRFVYTQCFTRDVTERKRNEHEREHLLESERAARTQAEQAGRLKDEFLATVSHELRTPLNGILGWAQLLKRARSGESSEAVDAIERNARAQAQIIDDLLDMNRIMSGKLRLEVQSIELAPVIEAALETVRPSAEAKNIRVETILNPGGGPIQGDPTRLQQVVWNLLSNAVKFTPEGGNVQVLLKRVNSQVEISVTDTGMGIKPEFRPHVFERFRQADSSTTRQHGGLGLGLAIVKQIVELHGGSICADSGGEGKGATFHVRLPVSVVRRRPLAAPLVPAAPACDKVDLKGVRILVVDDDPDACEVLRRLLHECEAEVETAGSGPEGLDRIAASAPDLLLCEIGMPGMDGFEVIRTVRAGGLTFPALAVTAFARADDRSRALQAGFNLHVSKPVEVRELLAVMDTLVRGLPEDAARADRGARTP